MTVLLALDLGLTTGAAYDTPRVEGVPMGCVIRSVKPTGDKEQGRAYGPTFAEFHDRVSLLIERTEARVVAYEAPLQALIGGRRKDRPDGKPDFGSNPATVRILITLAGIVEMIATKKHIDCYEVNLKTVKANFAGNGNATKADMLARCKLFGWPAETHDVADAFGIWSYAKAMMDPHFSPKSTALFGRKHA